MSYNGKLFSYATENRTDVSLDGRTRLGVATVHDTERGTAVGWRLPPTANGRTCLGVATDHERRQKPCSGWPQRPSENGWTRHGTTSSVGDEQLLSDDTAWRRTNDSHHSVNLCNVKTDVSPWTKLIIRVINFELVQPIRPKYINVTDGQADRRTDGRTS